jgi:hypothetical protein
MRQVNGSDKESENIKTLSQEKEEVIEEKIIDEFGILLDDYEYDEIIETRKAKWNR